MMLAQHVYTGRIFRFGFGGPWMRGKRHGQLALFMIWYEDLINGKVEYAKIIYKIG